MKKQNFQLIISKKKPVFANQKGIPANQSQNGAKNLANLKRWLLRVLRRYAKYNLIFFRLHRVFISPLLGSE